MTTDLTDEDRLAFAFVEKAQARADEMGRDVRVLLALTIVKLDREMAEKWVGRELIDRLGCGK